MRGWSTCELLCGIERKHYAELARFPALNATTALGARLLLLRMPPP